MAFLRDSSYNNEEAFKIYRWKNCIDGAYDAMLALVWINLPKILERCLFPELLIAVGDVIGSFICVDHLNSMAQPYLAEYAWRWILLKNCRWKWG